MTWPRPNGPDLAGVRDAYDAGARELAARFPGAGAEAAQDLAMIDAFAAAVRSGDDPRVLDAGCGGGRMTRYLAERGCHVEGVDLSPGMIAMARRDHPELVFTVGELSDLPYRDDAFAGVMLWYSIIHTPPDELSRIAVEVARVLRPRGDVLIGFQAGEGTQTVSWASQHRMSLERHLHLPDHVASRCEAAGLRERGRTERRARGDERDDQAFLWLRDNRE